MAVYGDKWRAFRLIVWHAGSPPRLLTGDGRQGGWGAGSDKNGGYENDGVIDFAWSPDDRWLLLRPWGSGEKDMNFSSLLCLDSRRWRLYSVPGGACRMQWLGPRRVRYWVKKIVRHGHSYSLVLEPRPRFWAVPGSDNKKASRKGGF